MTHRDVCLNKNVIMQSLYGELKRGFEKEAVSTAVCLQESFQVTVLKRVNYRAELFKAG